MDNFLRQLLDMVSSIPAPGREPARPRTVPANSPGASVQNLREVPAGPQDFVPNEGRGQYADRQRAAGLSPDSGTQPVQEDEAGNTLASGAFSAVGGGAAAGARTMAQGAKAAAKAATHQRDLQALSQLLAKYGSTKSGAATGPTATKGIEGVLRQAMSKLGTGVAEEASEKTGVGSAAKAIKMADQEYDVGALGAMMKEIAKREGTK